MVPRVPISARWAWLLALILPTILSFWTPHPGQDGSARAPGFSEERLASHLKAIARKPHPAGSVAHREVREYIFGELRSLGLEVHEQNTTVAVHQMGQTMGATVRNVFARIPGRVASEKAVLLDAHYDSAPNSPGASDDGVWVAALLESARVLVSGPQLRRDVYLLFSDAEENGLLGARAFTRDDPTHGHVGLVLNYEAHGTRGHVLMFQTSPLNGDLVRSFGAGIAIPHAHSLFSVLSKLLPNDTNASQYRSSGWPVLGFAFAEGTEHYHRYTDTPQELSVATLHEIGPHTLGLARHFADLEKLPTARPDAVYFDVGGRWLITYSPGWAMALGSVCLLGSIAWVLRSLRAGRITRRDVRRGVWIQVGVIGLALLVPTVLGAAPFAFVDLFSWFAHAPRVGIGCLLCVIGLHFYGTARALAKGSRELGPKGTAAGLAGGGVLVTAAIGALLGWIVPEASACWQWPLLPTLSSFCIEERLERYGPACPSWVRAVAMAMVALLLMPVASAALGIAGPTLLLFPVLIIASQAFLLFPPGLFPSASWQKNAGLVLAVSGLVLSAGTTLRDRLAGPPSRTDSLVYAEDATSSSARYFTYDRISDDWVAKLIPAEADAIPLPAFHAGGQPLRQMRAELFAQPDPEIDVQAQNERDLGRAVTLRIRSATHARCLEFWQTAGPAVSTLSINAKPVETLVRFSPKIDEVGFKLLTHDHSPDSYRLSYCAMGEESLVLSLAIAGTNPVQLRMVEQVDSLPSATKQALPVRPPGVGPIGPLGRTDITLISRVLTL